MADMVEIPEDELRMLRGAKALQDSLLKDKRTRRKQEALVKELYPDTTTTDDLAAPYIEKLDALDKKLDKFFKDKEIDVIESKLAKDFDYLRNERSYTGEGIEKIKELMVKKSIPDAIAAADHWERQNPPEPQAPAGFQPSSWGFGQPGDAADLKLLFSDEDAWAEKTAKSVWDEETRKSGRILT